MNDCPQSLFRFFCILFSILILSGCQSRETLELREKVVLTNEPTDAVGVIAARTQMAGEAEPKVLTVEGRIGNDEHATWQVGRASFVLRDQSLDAGTAHKHSSGVECAFCKQRKKDEMTAQALVKFVDESGNVLPVDARALLGARGGESVVVRGMATTDQLGNLELVADGVFFRP